MHWYEGSIAEAVNLSKQRNAIFVVFVEGDNDLSTEMASTIDEGDVVKRLSDPSNFLAIKLKSGSTNYTHFAQIYQFVPVPSLFFIGRNGTPLEVVCAGVQPENLATRIDRILEEHHKEKPAGAHPSTSSDNIREQTVNFLHAEGTKPQAAKHEAQPETSSGPPAKVQKKEFHEVTKSGKEYDVVCDGDVCVRVPKADDAGPSGAGVEQDKSAPPVEANESTSSMEEKMERAKELIEARKREKAAKEKEAEKQKEMERRAQGQGVAELKKWQADQELKQIQEERKREKMENNLARQRILEQIAQDRAERRARDQPPPAPAQPTVSRPPPTAGDGSTRARIQFKLPDGTSHTAHFDAGGTLADVHTYVSENLQLSSSNFALWTAFPRRELTEPLATLRALQLTPSAALLVLPRRTHAPLTPPSTFSTIITVLTQLFTSFIMEPSQQLYNWLYARLYPAAPSEPPREPRQDPSPPRAPPVSPTAAPVRRRGNIHRLGEERSGDDDNNTWNGNSTQQM
ncbi:UBX domain-containing protein 4 isoform X2 [Pectinophora gossypiella]|uniref:UBX domain-containing protein 4 isoform X2 n=1 Tax=Pectinophora gossypiella TaxID=13191 RepID=UPI00214E4EA9|nr:UBX domain-containing protein 4 isoform X2 [Pectinophora gossypiella]